MLSKDGLPCVYFPWPVDTDRFKFKQRLKCERFLFLNGRGGWQGRKGGDVINQALKLWPEMPLLIRDQTNSSWPIHLPNVQVLPSCKNNGDLYSEGDVLINPCKVDGTGLQPMEAMACGMPVISTNGLPWNEIPAIARIDSNRSQRMIKRPMPWYEPIPSFLVTECKDLLIQEIIIDSAEVRKWAESRSFSSKASELTELIRNGVPS
jgi:hypothetical protein